MPNGRRHMPIFISEWQVLDDTNIFWTTDQCFRCFYPYENIRIHHECKGGIEKSIPRITDTRLAKWWQTVITRDDFFYPILIIFLIFLLTTKYLILCKTNIDKASRNSWIFWDATLWRHFNIQWRHRSKSDQRSTDVWLFGFYLSLVNVWVCEINRIHHWCSVGTEKSQPEGPPFQWETRLAEFPTERWTGGLGFFWNHWTPMIDSFSHIPRPYGTVLCNICWWRHWDRCLQSMTRAV